MDYYSCHFLLIIIYCARINFLLFIYIYIFYGHNDNN